MKILRRLKEQYKLVHLFVDVMYVNGLGFLHTISEKITFRTLSYLKSESKESISEALDKIIKLYRRGGYKI